MAAARGGARIRHVAGGRRPAARSGRNLGLDDLPSREEEELSDAMPGFDEGVLAVRDRALCHELVRLIGEPDSGGTRTVGVWTAPVILEALIPGRIQSHACTAEVPRGAA